MTCAEMEHVLPEIVEGVRTADQEAHLQNCRECSGILADVLEIRQQARSLQASEEPSSRVWQSISTTLGEWRSEMELIAEQARELQASEEPNPRVWDSIQETLNEWRSEMNQISEEAGVLADAEPSPRVWNSLEIELRKEGLIRRPEPLVAAGRSPGWRWAWLAPVAAALVVVGVTVYKPGDGTQRATMAKKTIAASVLTDDQYDQQVLAGVAWRAPGMRAVYENNLRSVNAYIRDARQSVKDDPTDPQAQESLMNAYEQKSMLYEMALDRSLP